jgi:hypothetical protein
MKKIIRKMLARLCSYAGLQAVEWVSVRDRLPEENQRVIYYFDVTGMDVGRYWKEERFGFDCFGGKGGWLCDDVTHWMPLPDEPLPRVPWPTEEDEDV